MYTHILFFIAIIHIYDYTKINIDIEINSTILNLFQYLHK